MKKAPKIRFDGYTEDWEQRKLSAIITEKLSAKIVRVAFILKWIQRE